MIGEFSMLAKRDGYFVAMAPAESYLDPSTSAFDRSLLHTYPEWKELQPDFAYRGHNTYAYLVSKYGTTKLSDASVINTFDLVTVQLYEGYSHAFYHIEVLKESPAAYLAGLIERLTTGWMVDFGADLALKWPSQRVKVPLDQLVIGLGNGWAGDGKFLLIRPEEIAAAYTHMKDLGIAPRGFAFWNILDEGVVPLNSLEKNPVWMARGLNQFLNIR